ncbi:hypothetical protein Tco_1525043 [Tanacetum coccineum]
MLFHNALMERTEPNELINHSPKSPYKYQWAEKTVQLLKVVLKQLQRDATVYQKETRKAIVNSSAHTYDPDLLGLEDIICYMHKFHEVTPDSVDNSGPIFDDEPMQRAQDDQDETDDLDQERICLLL